MAAITQFLTPQDFILKYKLSLAFNDGEDLINEYITLYEKPTMYKLFGIDLCNTIYQEFEDEQIYQILAEPIAFEHCKETYTTTGFKDILLSFIYFHYVRNQIATSTSIGLMAPKVEAGVPANDNNTNAFMYYNEAVRQANNLVLYMELNKETYPTFLGHKFETTWLF